MTHRSRLALPAYLLATLLALFSATASLAMLVVLALLLLVPRD